MSVTEESGAKTSEEEREAGESGSQLVLGKTGNGAQQRVGKLASDRRADLRHLSH